MTEPDPRELDPDYDKHGGFPRFEPIEEPPGFGRFVEAMRRAQDLAVSCDGVDWQSAADRVEDLVDLLTPHQVAGGVGPASSRVRGAGTGVTRSG